jgi:hypothetical protein
MPKGSFKKTPLSKFLRKITLRKRKPFPFVALVTLHPQKNYRYLFRKKDLNLPSIEEHLITMWNETHVLFKDENVFTAGIYFGREDVSRPYTWVRTKKPRQAFKNLKTEGDLNIVINHKNGDRASMRRAANRLIKEFESRGISRGKVLVQGLFSSTKPDEKPNCADLLRYYLKKTGYEVHFSEVVKLEAPKFGYT